MSAVSEREIWSIHFGNLLTLGGDAILWRPDTWTPIGQKIAPLSGISAFAYYAPNRCLDVGALEKYHLCPG